MSIADEALAFRIWQHCNPIGWTAPCRKPGMRSA